MVNDYKAWIDRSKSSLAISRVKVDDKEQEKQPCFKNLDSGNNSKK